MGETPIVYGIANCDTVRKTRRWLDERGVDYRFHDYRKQGLDPALLDAMESALGWETLLNRRGTSWRGLPEATRNGIDRRSALDAMLDNPALIKRPVLARGRAFEIGFSEARYEEIFN